MSSKLKKTKKPTALHTEETHPFIVRRPYTEDREFPSFNQARAHVLGLIESHQIQFTGRFGNSEDKRLVDEAVSRVQSWTETGGSVDQMIDSYSGVRFRAEVIPR